MLTKFANPQWLNRTRFDGRNLPREKFTMLGPSPTSVLSRITFKMFSGSIWTSGSVSHLLELTHDMWLHQNSINHAVDACSSSTTTIDGRFLSYCR
jgi:hypothetical protein